MSNSDTKYFDKLLMALPQHRQTSDLKIVLKQLCNKEPTIFMKEGLGSSNEVLDSLFINQKDLDIAAARWQRWQEALTMLFPELADSQGLIESPIFNLNSYQELTGINLPGKTIIKGDHALPVAGSIKARGGVYEVLAFAEKVGEQGGFMKAGGNPKALLSKEAKAYLSTYKIAVGSTGNLGFSIGVMASALGFNTAVHMSQDAKQWKKTRLRSYGVNVVEHSGDFAAAVKAGRAAVEDDPKGYFIDDEDSLDLFLGYSVAALRLQKQLESAQITVDESHPLFVYLPCGVGGSPGGITWGLKTIYGDNVKCFFAEPTASPAFLLRSLTEKPCTTYDFGLNNRTEADGLAVAQASDLVYELVGKLVSGYFTVDDNKLFEILVNLKKETDIKIEPSAAAGFLGPVRFNEVDKFWAKYFPQYQQEQVSHIFWTTGGAFVPESEYDGFYQKGLELIQARRKNSRKD